MTWSSLALIHPNDLVHVGDQLSDPFSAPSKLFKATLYPYKGTCVPSSGPRTSTLSRHSPARLCVASFPILEARAPKTSEHTRVMLIRFGGRVHFWGQRAQGLGASLRPSPRTILKDTPLWLWSDYKTVHPQHPLRMPRGSSRAQHLLLHSSHHQS